MKISTKSRYGIRAVLEIALQRNGEKCTRKQISQNQEIPSSYLVNILLTLKTEGIIRTIRGPKGGYELVKNPENITVLQLVEILEGTTESVPCTYNEGICSRSSICVTKKVWKKLQEAQEKVLRDITIQSLVDETLSLYSPDFSI